MVNARSFLYFLMPGKRARTHRCNLCAHEFTTPQRDQLDPPCPHDGCVGVLWDRDDPRWPS